MENKKKKIIIIIGVLVTLGVIHFIYDYVMYIGTDNAQVDAHSMMLAPRVAGYVRAVHVKEGQRVKQGEVLVEIDDRDFQNALKHAKGDVGSIEARRLDAERTFSRISELFRKGAVSRQQYDQASANLREARAKHDSVSALVDQAELNLTNTHVVAPADGFIAKKSVEVGQLAAVGVPIIGFIDSGDRWITANFKETDLDSIRIGSKADIDIDAISGETFKGVVESISAATGATFTLLPPDNATGNFTKVVQRVPVRIRIENLTPERIEKLRAGLSADVTIHKH